MADPTAIFEIEIRRVLGLDSAARTRVLVAPVYAVAKINELRLGRSKNPTAAGKSTFKVINGPFVIRRSLPPRIRFESRSASSRTGAITRQSPSATWSRRSRAPGVQAYGRSGRPAAC